MKAVVALWTLAALLVAAGAATLCGYGILLADRIGEMTSANDRFWQMLNALYATIGPLFTAGLIVALIALSTHALLWARAATPE